MNPNFTALLCLGLSLLLRTKVLAGMIPKPTIRAEPSSIVPKGTEVTISCEGTAGALGYYLNKCGQKDFWWPQNPLYPGNRAHWFIRSIEMNQAGRYNCSYFTRAGWSEHSDSVELVVTGIFNSKPQLLALPTPLVTSAENLTLHCVSQEGYDTLVLTEEGEQNLSMSLDSQHSPIWKSQALFTLGPLIPNSRRTFRCYGYNKTDPQKWSEPSDPLEIQISGMRSYQAILIGVSVVFFLLFLLIFLLLRWKCQHKCKKEVQSEITDIQLPEDTEEPVPRERGPQKRSFPATAIKKGTSYDSVKIQHPKGRVERDSLNTLDEDPLKEVCTEVKHYWLRRTGAASLPLTLSRELLHPKNREAEDREMDSEVSLVFHSPQAPQTRPSTYHLLTL